MRPELMVGLGFGLALAPPALVVQAQTIDDLFRAGNAAQAAGDYAEAERIFREVIRQQPESGAAYNNLGIALYDQGRLDEAIAAYETAINIEPRASRYNNLGNALRDLGRPEEAIEAYRTAIDLDPTDPFPYNGLGNVLDDLERWEEAIEAYRTAIDLDPTNPLPYNGLGNALDDLGRPAEAIEAYRTAIELDPTYPLPYNGLGNILRDLGRPEEAADAYRTAIELDPTYPQPYNGLGNILQETGQLEEALTTYRTAIDLDPTRPLPYNGLGNTFLLLGNYPEAIANYQRSIDRDPNDALPYNGWGYALQLQGDYTGAIEKYRQALALDPTYTTAQNNLAEAQRQLQEQISGIPNLQDELAWLPTVEAEPLLPTLRSVVLVSSRSGGGFERGTGWVVKKEGDRLWIITNRHVVWDEAARRENTDVELEFFSEPPPNENRLRLPARILEITAHGDAIDLALLVVDNAPADIQPLAMAPGDLPRESPVRVVGHPSTGLPWTVDEGLVSNRSFDKLQISQASLAAGSSGSPVLDESNRVVGVVVEVSNPGEVASTAGFGFAYHLPYLADLLGLWGLEIDP